jgi:hypothetical protein
MLNLKNTLRKAIPVGFIRTTYNEIFDLFVTPHRDHANENEFLYKIDATSNHDRKKNFSFFVVAKRETFSDRNEADRLVACHGVNTIRSFINSRVSLSEFNFSVPLSRHGITIIPC